MKGQGTFRRALSSALAVIGLSSPLLRVPSRKDAIPDPIARQYEDVRKGTKRRIRRKGKATMSAKNWPLLFWGGKAGDCQKPLSKKALKRIAPGHPLLVKAK